MTNEVLHLCLGTVTENFILADFENADSVSERLDDAFRTKTITHVKIKVNGMAGTYDVTVNPAAVSWWAVLPADK
ncbi:MAG: hypothetical protein M3036_11275 [Bifidobacteriales bacterium]|nr:hypothetical protein [Bifidobacteriales bacterium]